MNVRLITIEEILNDPRVTIKMIATGRTAKRPTGTFLYSTIEVSLDAHYAFTIHVPTKDLEYNVLYCNDALEDLGDDTKLTLQCPVTGITFYTLKRFIR